MPGSAGPALPEVIFFPDRRRCVEDILTVMYITKAPGLPPGAFPEHRSCESDRYFASVTHRQSTGTPPFVSVPVAVRGSFAGSAAV